MPQIVKYDIQEGTQNRVEFGRRQQNLIIQLFPKRDVSTEEALSQDGSSPSVKIIMAIDQYNPRHIETEIKTPIDKVDIGYYTIELKKFFDLPTDTNYLRDKIVKALRELVL
jgi:hypothetical protein